MLTLSAGVALGLATAGFLAAAGRITQRRAVSREQVWGAWAFAAWWYAASFVIFMLTLRTILAVSGVRDVAAFTALTHILNLGVTVAVGALLYYILFLLTGRRNLIGPVGVVYAAYFLYLTWYAQRGGARHVVIGEWQAQLVAEQPPAPVEVVAFGLLLALPILLTVAVYAVMAFRVRDPSHRYRLRLIAGGFLFLFGSILLGFLAGWTEASWFPLAYQVPALLTSILVVLAYRPPRWVQHRLGVEPVRPGPSPLPSRR